MLIRVRVATNGNRARFSYTDIQRMSLSSGAKVFYAKDHSEYRLESWHYGNEIRVRRPCYADGRKKGNRWFLSFDDVPYELYVDCDDPCITVKPERSPKK